MPHPANHKDHIFVQALERPAEQRSAYLDSACGDDQILRAEIEELLACHDKAGSFMLEPPVGISAEIGRIKEGPGTVIGRYELLEQIGEGGFGIVFLAQQLKPVKREVALKIVKPGMDTRLVIARFEAERQALALMDHPNVAKILDAGETDSGRPYFVMELVTGISLTEYCDRHSLSARQRLELFVPVCRAVQHAHQKGIIHRDLKPSNIMISMHDSTPIPVIIDFGISKALHEPLTDKTLFTAAGQMVGTPQYMSPEQAGMHSFDIDTRSDIYSLGVLLYELLTSTTPLDNERLRGTAFAEVQRLIRDEEAPTPSTRLSSLGERVTLIAQRRHTDPTQLRHIVRGDLDWIVMKALEKERDQRYSTAIGLANDVERFLRDEVVSAGPPSIAYKLYKFARRNRGPVAAAVVLFAVVFIGIIGTTTGMIRANRARTMSEWQSYRQQIGLAHRELQAHRPVMALRLLNGCPRQYRNWEWSYLYRLAHTDHLEPTQVEMPGRVLAVDCSPTRPEVAVAATENGSLVTVTMREEVETQLLVKGDAAPIGVWHDIPPMAVKIGPRSELVALANGPKPVSLRELRSGKELSNLPGQGVVMDVTFHPDSEVGRIATASHNATVWRWETNGTRLPGEVSHDLWASCAAYSPNQLWLATGSYDRSVIIWEANVGKPLKQLHNLLHPSPVTCLAFSQDSRLLATGTVDRSGVIWDMNKGRIVQRLVGHRGLIIDVAFCYDGSRVATASTDQTVRLWDVNTGEEMLTLVQDSGNFSDIAFSQDGKRLLAANRTKMLTIWDSTVEDLGNSSIVLTGHEGRVWDVAFTRDGLIVSAAEDGTVRIWDPQTGEPPRKFTQHANVVFDIALHPGEDYVASVGPFRGNLTTHGVRLWDFSSGEVMEKRGLEGELTIKNRHFHSVDISPNGQWLVTAGVEAVRLWDVLRPLKNQDKILGRHEGIVWSTVFSPCGRYLATAGSEGTVKLWDAQKLDVAQDPLTLRLPHGEGHVTRMAFSPDGEDLAYGNSRGEIILIGTQATSADEAIDRPTWNAHRHSVRCVRFSPDGEYLASGSVDETVKLWHVKTRRLVRNFLANGPVRSVAFSPDGQWLASGDDGKTVHVWKLEFGAKSNQGHLPSWRQNPKSLKNL